MLNALPAGPNHSIALQRPHLSEFSRLYNAHIPEEQDFDSVVSSNYIIVPAPALDQYPWPLLDAHQNAALNYYMKHVLRMQYLHASESLDSIIWNLIHTSDNARQAACLLSDLHRRCTQRHTLATIEPQDLEALSHMQLVPLNRPLTEGDALAGLCIVSYFLFSGGKGQWQTFLDAATSFSLSILNHPCNGGPRRVLFECSESIRFIIKTSIWFDVLASATLLRAPRFLQVIRELFGPPTPFFDGEPLLPMAEYSMMSVMGCDNHIVLALAEIASLAYWKEAQVGEGKLSVKELVRRGHKIEELLKKPSSSLSEFSNELEQRAHQRWLTSEVFRASAHVYLHSVISGNFPQCPDIIDAVNNTVERLKEAEDGPTGRAVVRSVVFSICICGCLTEDRGHQAYFRKRLEEQQGLSFGNSQQVLCLIQDVWNRRSCDPAVDWRKVMREAEMLLV